MKEMVRTGKSEKGFSLIELVMVMVILAIIAAIATPVFVDLQTDARKAAVDGMAGAVRSAALMTHARALVDGSTGATGSVSTEAGAVTTAFGYPDAATGGINVATSFSAFTFTTGASTSTFTKDGAPTPASCVITYVEPASAGTAPTISTTKTGC